MVVRRSFCLALALCVASTGLHAQSGDLQASYDFLVRERSAGGALLNFPIANGNYLLPSSYYDTGAYWGTHVCERSSAKCAVKDTYNVLNYELSPEPGAAGTLQVERVNAHTGANIYDAATWQIAVMVGYVKNKFRLSSPTSAYSLASGLSQVLPLTKRAITADKTFVYNGSVIAEGPRAYAFRALAPAWLAPDPLMDTPQASFITARNLPPLNAAYATGKISWSDWKPITGENAWAFLIGPLQAAHLHHVVFEKKTFVPFSDLAVQNALDLLPTFAAMQSAVGGVYYAPAGTIGNEGDAPVDPHEISVENNFSLYAGLQILRSTLGGELESDAASTGDEKTKIADALRLIEAMISGGRIGNNRETKGLLSFFRMAAWQNGAFVQGGLADGRDWVPANGTKAVDVQTWGIAALGAKRIDQWFGDGASYALWQQLKTWGGYGVGHTLWGVGYSDKDGNGIDPSGAYRQGVMSGEWTAGAITAVRNMIAYYGAEERSSPHAATAKKYVASLKQDEAAMLTALATLRIDRYPSAGFPGTPPDYAALVSVKTKPYLYASTRYHIPFGWYANPLPSTASTAWMIMVADHYDPFGYAGAPN